MADQEQAPIVAQSADGIHHQFPAGTAAAVIDGVMKRYAADSLAASAKEPEEAVPAEPPKAARGTGALIATTVAQQALKLPGGVVETAGSTAEVAALIDKANSRQQLEVFDRIDRGETVKPQAVGGMGYRMDQDLIWANQYASKSPEERAEMRRLAEGNIQAPPDMLQRAGESVRKTGEGMLKWAEKSVPLTPEEEGRTSVQVTKLLTMMVPYVAAAVTTGGAGLVGYGTLENLNRTYTEAVKQGADPEKAAVAAVENGSIQGLLNVVPAAHAAKILERLPDAAKGKFVQLLADMALGAGNMLTMTQVGQLAENAVAQKTFDPGRPWDKGLGENLAVPAIAGAILPVGAGAVGAAARAMRPRPEAVAESVMRTETVDDAIAEARALVEVEPVDTGTFAAQAAELGGAADQQQAKLLQLFGGLNRGEVERTGEGSYQYRVEDDVTPLKVWDERTAPAPQEGEARTTIDPGLAAAQRDHYAKLGIDVVYFQNDAGIRFDGAVSPQTPDTIFLSNDPQRNAAQIGAHEVTHVLESTRLPDGTRLGDMLHSQIEQGLTGAGLRHAYETFGRSAPDRTAFPEGPEGNSLHADAVMSHLVRELGADIGGEAPRFQGFITKVVDNVEQRYGLDAARDVMQKLLAGIRQAMTTLRQFFFRADEGAEYGQPDTVSQTWVTNLGDIHGTLAKMYAERFGTQAEKENVALRTMRDGAVRDRAVAALEGPAAEIPPPTMPEGFTQPIAAEPPAAMPGPPPAPTYGEALQKIRRYQRWLGELDQQRRTTADASPQAKLLRQTEAVILGKVKGVEERLTKAAADRLAKVRADLDALVNPDGDSPSMTKVREQLLAEQQRMADAAAVGTPSPGMVRALADTPASVAETPQPEARGRAVMPEPVAENPVESVPAQPIAAVETPAPVTSTSVDAAATPAPEPVPPPAADPNSFAERLKAEREAVWADRSVMGRVQRNVTRNERFATEVARERIMREDAAPLIRRALEEDGIPEHAVPEIAKLYRQEDGEPVETAFDRAVDRWVTKREAEGARIEEDLYHFDWLKSEGGSDPVLAEAFQRIEEAYGGRDREKPGDEDVPFGRDEARGAPARPGESPEDAPGRGVAESGGGPRGGSALAGEEGAPLGPIQSPRTASWVIRHKETGAVVMETFDPKKVEALNTKIYEAVPIQQHLAEVNRKARGEEPSFSPRVSGSGRRLDTEPAGPALIETREAAPDELGARQRQVDKERAQLAMRGRKVARAPQELADDTPLFGGDRQKTLFSPRRERELIIQHNVTAANLLHADRMGGIAAPSLAINKAANANTSFGEITLIGPKEMADPKGYVAPKVFGSDIYSPRYPDVQYKVDKTSVRKLNDLLAPFREGGERERYTEILRPDDLRGDKAFDRYAEKNFTQNGYADYRAAGHAILQEAGAAELIFKGFTNSGNRSYTPHTLETVLRILKKELRGGEGFNYGVGSLRAKFTPQFRSVEQIRKNADRLVSKEDFEAVKKEIDAEFWDVANELQPYSHRGKEFGFGDAVINAMSEAPKIGLSRALDEYNIKGVPDDVLAKAIGFLEKLRHLPTEYFEAKILRGVGMSEFRIAVVPDSIDPAVRSLLEKRGVEVVEYKKGDEADRRRAVNEIANSRADEVMFSPKITGDNPGRDYTPAQLKARENVRGTERRGVFETIGEWREDLGKKLVREIFDPYVGLKDRDPAGYLAARMANSSTGAVDMFNTWGTLKFDGPVYATDKQTGGPVALIRDLGKEAHDFMDWVAANRAERLKAEDRENLFTADDIAALKELNQGTLDFDYALAGGKTTRSREAAYLDALKRLDVANKNAQTLAVDAGLLKRDTVDELWSSPFYVPFYRQAEEGGSRGFVGGSGSGGFTGKTAFKKLKGGTEKLTANLWQNAFGNWSHLIDASIRNKAANQVLETALKDGIVERVTAKQYDHEMTKAEKADVIWTMVDGEKTYWRVDDAFTLKAITALDYVQSAAPLMGIGRAAKRLLQTGVAASPIFQVRNLIRDTENAIAVSPIAKNVFRNLADGARQQDIANGLKNVARAVAGQDLTQAAISRDTADAVAGGATMRYAAGVDQSFRQADTYLDSASKIGKFWDYFRRVGTASTEAMGFGENMNRLALYRQLGEQGAPRELRAYEARDISDFTLTGASPIIRHLVELVPYMNAWMQGLYKVGRAAADSDRNVTLAVGGKVAAQITKRLAAVTMGMVALNLALDAIYADDEDYQNRNEYDRNSNFWFKVGGTEFRIPMGFEVAALARMSAIWIETMYDKDMTAARAWKNTLSILGTQMAFNPIPQAVKPLYDLAANETRMGAPIESNGMERLRPEFRAAPNTTLVSQGISEGMNKAVRAVAGPNARAFSPVQLDYLVQAYAGWLGTSALQIADTAVRTFSSEPERPSRDMVGRLTGGIVSNEPTSERGSGRYVNMLYQQGDAIKEAYATYRDLAKRSPEQARAYLEDNRDTILKHRTFERVIKIEGDLNEQIRSIENSSSLSGEQKKIRIMQLTAMKNRAARAVFAPEATP